jgi:hypothetical protein
MHPKVEICNKYRFSALMEINYSYECLFIKFYLRIDNKPTLVENICFSHLLELLLAEFRLILLFISL